MPLINQHEIIQIIYLANGNGSASSYSEIDTSTFKAIVSRWIRGGGDGYNPMDVLSSATAVTVLGELSVGGSLMRGAQPNAAIRKLF